MRQVLVIPDVPLFDTCVIASSSTATPNTVLSSATPTPTPTMASREPVQATVLENSLMDNSTTEIINTTEHLGEDESFRDATLHLHESNEQHEITNNTENIGDNSSDSGSGSGSGSGSLKHFEFTEVDIDFNNISDTIDVEPASFDIDRSAAAAATAAPTNATTPATQKQNVWKNGGQVTLKKHKEVLYEMYKVAKRKAQEAKKAAIRAYLEAKEIKATYMLDDLEDSESGSGSGSESESESESESGGANSKYKK